VYRFLGAAPSATLRVDRNRIGFLLADVSGHGVPAALIKLTTPSPVAIGSVPVAFLICVTDSFRHWHAMTARTCGCSSPGFVSAEDGLA